MKLSTQMASFARAVVTVGTFFIGAILHGQDHTIDWIPAEVLHFTKSTQVSRTTGFSEFTNSADAGEAPKKFRTLTWGGSVKESGTVSFIGTQRTDFTGIAQFTAGVLQNGLLRRQFRNLDDPAYEGDGSGGPYYVIGDGSGACWPATRQNLLNEFPGSVGETVPVITQRTIVGPTRRETLGYMDVAWSRVAFPCNLYTFQTHSDTFAYGPMTEVLSNASEPVIVSTEKVAGVALSLTASLSYRMEDNSTWAPMSTSPVLIEDIGYEFRAVFRGICANKVYNIKVEYDTWQGTGASATPPVRSERLFCAKALPSGSNLGEVEVAGTLTSTKMGQSMKIVAVLLEKGENCTSCASDDGSSHVAIKSVHWSMSLGTLVGGGPAGILELEAETWSASLYAPAALKFIDPITHGAPVSVVRRADGSLRQIRTGTRFVDVILAAEDPALPAGSYEVRYQLQAGATPSASDPGVLVAVGAPIHTTRFYDPDGQGKRLAIVKYGENFATPFSRAEFGYEAGTNTWSLTEGGIRRTDTSTTVLSATEDEVLTSVWQISPTTVLQSQVKEKYRQYVASGRTHRVLVERIVDPTGAVLRATWDYIVDSRGILRLTLSSDHAGGWKKHLYALYSPVGPSNPEFTRIYETYSPFVNSGPTSSSSAQFRHVEVEVPDVDFDGDGKRDGHQEIYQLVGGIMKGVRGKRFTKLVLFDGVLCRVAEEAQLLAPGFSPTDAALKWERRLTYASGPFAGELAYVLRPDGTLETTTFAIDSATGNVTTVRSAGATDAAKLGVVDGRRTTVVAGADGRLISKSTLDVVSGLELERETVVSFDPSGRPKLIAYLDGSTEERIYSSCCGRLERVSRHGREVIYDYDALGRKFMERADGMATLYTYDALDRVTKVVRRGSDGTEIVQQSTEYDLAGRMIRSVDAAERATTYAVVHNADRTTRRTTTFPDLSTLVEITNADGTPRNVSGTRAYPKYWEYAIGSVDGVSTFAATEFKGETGTIVTEWIRRQRDGWGRELKVEYPGGAAERRFFDAAGRLIRQKDADNVTTLFGYNARGERDTVAIDMNGNGNIDFAGTDRIVRTTSAAAMKVVGGTNYVVAKTTTQLWEADGQDVATTVAVNESSVDGLRAWSTNRGLTSAVVTAFDGTGRSTLTSTAPDGVTTTQVYEQGRLRSTTVATAGEVQLAATINTYDVHGRLWKSADARNGETIVTYYPDDQVHTITTPDPDSTKSGPGYDPQTTVNVYDAAGRLSSVTHPDGGVVNTTYWPTGAVKRTWGSRTYPVEYTYDTQGRVKTLTTWRDFTGDAGRAVTTWNYDATRGFLASKRYADGTGPSYTYKPSGRMLTRTWARTPVVTTTYGYNAAGDLTTIDYSDTTPDVTLGYDRAGRNKSVNDGVGSRLLAYHSSGQVEDESYTSGVLNGYVIDRTYDALQRVSGIAVPGISSVAYSYDAGSRFDTVTSSTSTATYAYHANSALVSSLTFKHAGAPRLVTTKSYDRLNRLAMVSSAPSTGAPLSHSYIYNAANQRTRATREDASFWDYGYDTLGQVTSGKKFTGAAAPALGLDHAWTYDDIGNRKTAVENGAGASYTANALNQYDQRSVPSVIDVLGAAEADATVTLAVNGAPLQRPARQGEAFYQAVPIANSAGPQQVQLSVTGVRNLVGANGEDAIATLTRSVVVPQTPELFAHDLDGNLTADARWLYTWDGENRLVAMESSATYVAAGASRRRLEFAYDGGSRRIAKKVSNWNGTTWTLASHTLFLYDGWNMIAELNALSSNAPMRTYVWGADLSGGLQGAGGVGGLLFLSDVGTTSTHFASYDGNGNVVGLLQAANGQQTARYDYTAFGETVHREGSFAMSNPIGFSTKYGDLETGHLYYGYRCYTPENGRWLSKDPIEEEGGLNLYAFVLNDPNVFFDYLGNSPRHPNSGNSSGASTGGLINGIRIIWALPFDLLSGDFLTEYKPTIVNKESCNVLITVNGIWNNSKAMEYINRSVATSNRYRGAQAVQGVNPTNYLGDLAQIVGDELGAIQTSSRRLARQINSIYDQLMENNCACGKIQVFAHSQGTMVVRRAIPLIKEGARKIIYYTGIGGQTTIQGDTGFSTQENYASYTDVTRRDLVPLANFNPFRAPTWLFNGMPYYIKINQPVPNWMEHSYNPYYEDFVLSLSPN